MENKAQKTYAYLNFDEKSNEANRLIIMKGKTDYRYIIVIIVLLGVIAMMLTGNNIIPSASANQGTSNAEKNIIDLYKIAFGSDVEVMKTVEQGGLYKVTVRLKDSTGRDMLQDIFVTKDGMYYTNALVDLQSQKTALASQSSFAQCLIEKQVKIIGTAADTSTQAQLQALGTFSGSLLFDCNSNAAICQQLNITTIPMIFISNQLVQGPQNTEWFIQATGCNLTA